MTKPQNTNFVPRLLFALLLSALLALGQTPKPITKKGLIDALKIGGLQPIELVNFVKQRGVDFRMTPQDETDLRGAGAQPALLDAVRASYRGAAAAPKPAPVKQPPQPAPTPPPTEPTPPPPTSPGQQTPPPAQSTPPAPVATAPPQAASHYRGPASLHDVRRLYIEKMPEDLDQYIRAEIVKQMKGRIELVLRPGDADAIMTGISDEKTGVGQTVTGRYLGLHDMATGTATIVDVQKTRVLWAEEAGDRSLLFGAIKRGGQRKVAERLVAKLRKAF